MNREEKYVGKAERYLHLFESEIEPVIFLLSVSHLVTCKTVNAVTTCVLHTRPLVVLLVDAF